MSTADYSGMTKWIVLFVVVIIVAICLFTGTIHFDMGPAPTAATLDPADHCLRVGPVNACFREPGWKARPVEPDQDEHN